MRWLATSSDTRFSALVTLLIAIMVMIAGAVGYGIKRFTTRVDTIDKALTAAVVALEVITSEFKESKTVVIRTVEQVSDLSEATAVLNRVVADHITWSDKVYERMMDKLESMPKPKDNQPEGPQNNAV